MSATLELDPMTKKRNDKAVKIARDLAAKAKLIAESRNISLAEYLTGLLRKPIEKDWPKAVQDIERQPDDDGNTSAN